MNDFKIRFQIKRYVYHNEIKNVNRVIVEKKLMKFREKLALYVFENIFNMNESALYWKMTFDEILITEQMFEIKQIKTKILINLIVNVIERNLSIGWPRWLWRA